MFSLFYFTRDSLCPVRTPFSFTITLLLLESKLGCIIRKLFCTNHLQYFKTVVIFTHSCTRSQCWQLCKVPTCCRPARCNGFWPNVPYILLLWSSSTHANRTAISSSLGFSPTTLQHAGCTTLLINGWPTQPRPSLKFAACFIAPKWWWKKKHVLVISTRYVGHRTQLLLKRLQLQWMLQNKVMLGEWCSYRSSRNLWAVGVFLNGMGASQFIYMTPKKNKSPRLQL